MAKVDTNVVSLAYAREETAGTQQGLGTNGDAYKQVEPNEITDFGATISTTAREPISDKLQRRKGAVTDLDAAVGFSTDLTVDALTDWLESVAFAAFQNKDVRDLPWFAPVSNAGSNSITIDSLKTTSGADARGKFAAGSLLWLSGSTANNGLKAATAAPVVASGLIAFADDSINDGDATGTAMAPVGRASLAGYRVEAGAGRMWAWNASTKEATLTLTAQQVTAIRAALVAGQMVHFGSVASLGGMLQNGLPQDGNGAMPRYGFARYTGRFTTTTLIFDQLSENLQVSGNTGDSSNSLSAAGLMDILYGDVLKNVARSDDLYSDASDTVLLVSPDLTKEDDSTNPDGLEYAVGAKVSTLALNFPLTDKATMDVSMLARDVKKVVAGTAPSAFRQPVFTAPFNTTSDFARLRVVGVDEDGLDSDFKSCTVTINPQLTADKVLNRLGAAYINRGNLLVDIEAQAIFSTREIPDAIRDNATMQFGLILGNQDGVIAIDVPAQTLSGGGREYPQNESVLLNTTGASFEDDDFGVSLIVSLFPVPIPTASATTD